MELTQDLRGCVSFIYNVLSEEAWHYKVDGKKKAEQNPFTGSENKNEQGFLRSKDSLWDLCEDTYPDRNLQFLKCSFKADLQQVVNRLGGDDLERGHNMKDTMNKDSVRVVQDPWLGPSSSAWSHPSDLGDGTLCDLLVDAKARRTLEEGDGFPQVALGHLYQRRDTLHRHEQWVDSPGLLCCLQTERIQQLPQNLSLSLGRLTNDW